jgi:hypothetical protein
MQLARLANNVAFMASILALTAWTGHSASCLAAALLIFWASATLFWDGLFHIVTTAACDRYSPGLVTSSLVYIPISLLIASAALRDRALSVTAFLSARWTSSFGTACSTSRFEATRGVHAEQAFGALNRSRNGLSTATNRRPEVAAQRRVNVPKRAVMRLDRSSHVDHSRRAWIIGCASLVSFLPRMDIWLHSALATKALSMATASEFILEQIRDSGEFTLYRARQRVSDMPLLVVAPTAEQPLPQSLRRLEHEYSLAAELEPAWAAKPIALTRHEGRTILVIEDPAVSHSTAFLSATGDGLSIWRVF